MVLAAIGSTPYNILLLLHLLTVIIAFGTMFTLPSLRRTNATLAARFQLVLVIPAMVLLWVFGMGMLGLSEQVIRVSDTWIWLSTVVWALALAVMFFVQRPALLAPAGDRSAEGRASASTGAVHLLLLVALVLMIWKPGFAAGL